MTPLTVLDAYALIALLTGEGSGSRARSLVQQGGAAITSVNLAECADVLQRRFGVSRQRTRMALAALTDRSIGVLAVDESGALRAADLRAKHYHRSHRPLSLADCVLLAAGERGARVATADAHVLATASDEGIGAVDLRNAD